MSSNQLALFAVEPRPVTETETLTQPLKWHGGKHYLAQRIIALMPPHVHYVEPFAGGLSVLWQTESEGMSEVVNDLNGDLTNFWRVLQDPQSFERFRRQVEAIPFSQVEWRDSFVDGTGDAVQRAVRFFVRYRQSRQGIGKDSATLSRNRTRRGMNEQASSWLTAVEGLPEVHRRLQRVVILDQDALEVIRSQDSANTLFYCDPPYLHETRTSTGEYAHEMTREQHSQLLDLLGEIEGKFVLSGYPSELYSEWADRHGFRCERIEIDNKASSSKEKEINTERIWMNY